MARRFESKEEYERWKRNRGEGESREPEPRERSFASDSSTGAMSSQTLLRYARWLPLLLIIPSVIWGWPARSTGGTTRPVPRSWRAKWRCCRPRGLWRCCAPPPRRVTRATALAAGGCETTTRMGPSDCRRTNPTRASCAARPATWVTTTPAAPGKTGWTSTVRGIRSDLADSGANAEQAGRQRTQRHDQPEVDHQRAVQRQPLDLQRTVEGVPHQQVPR